MGRGGVAVGATFAAHVCSHRPPPSTPHRRPRSSAPSSSFLPYILTYLLTYLPQIIGSFVFLNLVVAVILENFEKMSNVNSNLVSASDLELFSEAWAVYDPDADNYIPVTDVPELLLKVPPPLGVKGRPKRHAVKLCLLLRLETRDGQVSE